MGGRREFPAEWIGKIYAGWLGKIIGIRLGAPVEGWTRERIRKTYGEKDGYLVESDRFFADDDSNGPIFFVRALEDSGKQALQLEPQDVAEAILNYVPVEHGFFWWGGYGVSTEHTVYMNLLSGIEAPASGSILQNGSMIAEQIGGQIFIDTWGLVAPGDPDLAVHLARKAASVMHDGEAVNGGVFIAACISCAFVEKDIEKILIKSFSYLPKDSTYRQVGEEIVQFYHAHPENWELCMDYIEAHHGYERYPGSCHIIPNMAVIILSLLYGHGDFSSAIQICNRCGWDTDCNAGNVGTIMGVLGGPGGIEEKWRQPINDFLVLSSVLGALNNTDIPACSDYLVRQAAVVRGEQLPKEWACCGENKVLNCHFAYPGSTHAMEAYRLSGIQIKDGEKREISLGAAIYEPLKIESTDRFGEGQNRCLRISFPEKFCSTDKLITGKRTYLFPHDLADDRYDPAFSPAVYPGQTIYARVGVQCGLETRCHAITAQLFVYSSRTGKYFFGPLSVMTDEEVAVCWRNLSWTVPDMEGDLITQVGVAFGKKDTERTAVFLDSFTVSGSPSYQVDFAKERTEIWSFRHQEVSQFTRRIGHLYLEKNRLHLSGAEEGEAFTGSPEWKDYSVRAFLCPVKGEHHHISFRVQGGTRSYSAGLGPDGTLEICKKSRTGIKRLACTPYKWRFGETYELTITVKGNALKIEADGTALQATDMETPYTHGCIGFRTGKAGHLCCSGFSVRPVSEEIE